MTNKENIANNAFELFANQGFDAVSTKRIADASQVSEGLIFRHYGNKEGLLNAVITQLNNSLAEACPNSDDHKSDLKAIMEFPFTMEEELHNKLRLLYALSWQEKVDINESFAPFKERLIVCLNAINVPQAELESELILAYVHGFAVAVIQNTEYRHDLLLDLLRTKYTA